MRVILLVWLKYYGMVSTVSYLKCIIKHVCVIVCCQDAISGILHNYHQNSLDSKASNYNTSPLIKYFYQEHFPTWHNIHECEICCQYDNMTILILVS